MHITFSFNITIYYELNLDSTANSRFIYMGEVGLDPFIYSHLHLNFKTEPAVHIQYLTIFAKIYILNIISHHIIISYNIILSCIPSHHSQYHDNINKVTKYFIVSHVCVYKTSLLLHLSWHIPFLIIT